MGFDWPTMTVLSSISLFAPKHSFAPKPQATACQAIEPVASDTGCAHASGLRSNERQGRVARQGSVIRRPATLGQSGVGRHEAPLLSRLAFRQRIVVDVRNRVLDGFVTKK